MGASGVCSDAANEIRSSLEAVSLPVFALTAADTAESPAGNEAQRRCHYTFGRSSLSKHRGIDADENRCDQQDDSRQAYGRSRYNRRSVLGNPSNRGFRTFQDTNDRA